MNSNFGKLDESNKITFAPTTIYTPTAMITNPTAADYAAVGYVPVIRDNRPTAVGVTYTASGWAYNAERTQIKQQWQSSPVVAPTPVYSVEEVIYGLIEKNALAAVKEIVGDYWELFTMRDAIESDNEIFAAKWPTLKAAIIASGALTEDEIAAILNDAEV